MKQRKPSILTQNDRAHILIADDNVRACSENYQNDLMGQRRRVRDCEWIIWSSCGKNTTMVNAKANQFN
jgi:hypothetical protein